MTPTTGTTVAPYKQGGPRTGTLPLIDGLPVYKPLYQGHLAIARIASGERIRELGALLERLRAVPAGQGYGRFVLGHMAFHARRFREARRHLEAFVERSTSGRPALAIALEGEVQLARDVLARITSA